MRSGRISGLFQGENAVLQQCKQALADILPVVPQSDTFRWLNFFDADDVLGWPLRPLSVPYAQMVTDVEVNASSGLFSDLLYAWNPLSHSHYWKTPAVLDALELDLRVALEALD